MHLQNSLYTPYLAFAGTHIITVFYSGNMPKAFYLNELAQCNKVLCCGENMVIQNCKYYKLNDYLSVICYILLWPVVCILVAWQTPRPAYQRSQWLQISSWSQNSLPRKSISVQCGIKAVQRGRQGPDKYPYIYG